MTFRAQQEFHTATRHYRVGDEVDPKDVTSQVHELCLVTEVVAPRFKVILNANGGIGDDIVAETENYYQLPPCPFEAPAGKKFKTWAVKANGMGAKAVGTQISVVQDITCYAIWVAPKVIVTFDANGGTGSMAQVKVDKSSEYQLPACSFTAPEGKQFKGWSLDKVAVVASITPYADVTVYALWQDVPAPAPEPDELVPAEQVKAKAKA